MASAKSVWSNVKRKRLWKKKAFWIVAAVLAAAILAGVFFLSMRFRMKAMQAVSDRAVQSTTVGKGTISSTVEASGNLETAETVNVTAPTDVEVDEVLVESGDKVTEGQTLAKLNKTSVISALVKVQSSLDTIEDELEDGDLYELEEEELEGEQEELKIAKKELSALRKNPVITAPEDGVIGDVNVAENEEITKNTSSGNAETSGSAGNNNISASAMAYDRAETDIKTTGSPIAVKTSDSSGSFHLLSVSENTAIVISDYSGLVIQTPSAGAVPQKTIAETDMYTGTITWDCSNETFQEGTAYTATIVLKAKSGYTFSETNLPVISGAVFDWDIYQSGEGNVIKIKATYEKTAVTTQESAVSEGAQNSSEESGGTDISDKSTAGNGTDAGTAATGTKKKKDSSTESGNLPDTSAGKVTGSVSAASAGSASLSGASEESTSASSESYGNYETTVFTIEKQENVNVSVDVDELDILSVSEGQTATVTLDALEGEEYEGTITKVANSSSGGSGNAKYEVVITIPMNENMRIGMSASASIKVSEASDVLTIPMTALQQKGEETFVYTKKESDGSLSGEVTVETGLSDGQNVEITGGLSEGDTVYYTRTDTSSSDSDAFDGQFPGGGNNGQFSGGETMERDNGFSGSGGGNKGDANGFPGNGGGPSGN